jgi:hypothetical protein
MAMTKAERKELESAREGLRIYRALRWTAPVEPDVPKPSLSSLQDSTGFVFNQYSKTVERAWSSSVYHPEVRRPDGTYPFTSMCRSSRDECGRDARYFEARTDSGADPDRHGLPRRKGPMRLALIWLKTFVLALFRRNA